MPEQIPQQQAQGQTQQFTLQEVGARIKQRNPQQLANFSDVEIGQRAVQRKPELQSMIKTPEAPKSEPGILSKLGGGLRDFISAPAYQISKIGSSIGSSLADTEFGRAFGQKAREVTGISQQDAQQAQKTLQSGSSLIPEGKNLKPYESAREFAGDTIQSAVTLSTPFLGGGGVATKAFGGVAPKVMAFGKGVVPRALEFGAGSAASQVGTNVSEGNPLTQGVGKAFGIGAAFPVAGTALGAGARSLSRGVGNVAERVMPKGANMSERVVNSFVKPIQRFETYGKNPAKAIVEDVGTFADFDEGIAKAVAKQQEIGAQMNAILTDPKYANKGVTLTESLRPFDEAINTAVKQNNQAVVGRLQEARKVITDNLELDNATGQIVSKGQRQLAYLSPLEANKLKQEIGNITKYTGNPSDDKLVNSTLQKVYSDIRDRINTAVPEMASLNERWGNLKSAELAMKYREQIASRSNLIPLGARITGIGSLILGVSTLNPLTLAASVLSFGIDAALSSPAFKTKLAQFLAKSTPAERAIVAKEVPVMGSIMQRIFGASEIKPPPAIIKRELEKASEEILALPPARSMPMPPPNPMRGDKSGIIKDAPPPTQLPVEPRPGQFQLPEGIKPIEMGYTDKSGIIPNAPPPNVIPFEPRFDINQSLTAKRVESEAKLLQRRVGMGNAIEGKLAPTKKKVQNQVASVLGEKKTPFDDDLVLQYRAEQGKHQSTHLINTPQRIKLRKDITKKIIDRNKNVKTDKIANIVMGPPAAGKSSVFATPLSKKWSARIIDSDEAKELLPEFKGGKLAGAVHEESSDIATEIMKQSVKKGENIVMPLVGKDDAKVLKIAQLLKKKGYKVNLYLNDLPPEKAAQRAVERLKETGRFVDPDYVLNQVGVKPLETFKKIKDNSLFDYYEHRSNDVARGEVPKLIEIKNTPSR